MQLWLLVGLATQLVRAVSALSFDRAACQRATGETYTKACPAGTILVGPTASVISVQEAILSLPKDDSSHVLLIQPGVYQEQLNITRTGPVTLLGTTKSPNDISKNRVTILWKSATGAPDYGLGDNAFTSTLTVAPTLDSSLTGAGPTGHNVSAGTMFGNSDFRAYNVDFINDYAPHTFGPSLAVSVSYANAGIYNSRISSYQDTVYIGKLGNAYFANSEIAGQTDFLYGFGTAWIQSSKLLMRNCGGGITAWKGTNTTFPNKYGVYIHDSEVIKANSSLSLRGKCSLGRPWNSQHRSIFANTYLDDSIRSSGYTAWNPKDLRVESQTFMAEYKNTGPGFNEDRRKNSKIARLLSDVEFEPFSSPEKVFQIPFTGEFGNIAWIDCNPTARVF